VNAYRQRPPVRRDTGEPAAPIRHAVPDGISDAVPHADRERFDSLLRDARASYALRDDDVGVCWNWPLGLVRRAGLEIGRRLATRGRLADPRHVFESDPAEVVALVSGGGPDAQVLAERWAVREQAALERPPGHLDGGGPRDAPPELPPAVARLSALRDAVWSAAPAPSEAPLHGIGVGSHAAVGTARVVRHPEDLTRIVDGDVLVTVATTTAFNAVFPLLSAVVAEQGNLLSHTAILARELGLPAVVGVAGVMDAIHDGDVVEVDPRTGSIVVVDHAH
jgi:pyruvate,water dikinase